MDYSDAKVIIRSVFQGFCRQYDRRIEVKLPATDENTRFFLVAREVNDPPYFKRRFVNVDGGQDASIKALACFLCELCRDIDAVFYTEYSDLWLQWKLKKDVYSPPNVEYKPILLY